MNHNPEQIQAVLSRGVAAVLPNKEALGQLMAERQIRVYLGIDPTGALLTLGHSVVLRKLQQFADLGHEVILLIGNGTVRIGDPTGKDETRPTLTDEQIRANFQNWQEQASKVLDFSKITIRYNGDWLDKLTYTDIVQLMAKTTVQQLMERDMFQERIKREQPIHAHELIYPLLQGYDSVVMDVDLEIGGTDQTFNMMMGRHLQKVYHNKEKWVLATPIINGTDGRKMSKSLGNFIALTEEPNNMYGKLMSVADSEIITYFTTLTDVASEAIEEMESLMRQGHNPLEFKKQLALNITTMYHSVAAAKAAQEHFEKTVQGNELPVELPVVTIGAGKMTVLELLEKLMPEESRNNLRRLTEQGAVELMQQGKTSGSRPTDPFEEIETQQFKVVRVGKRRYFQLA